MQHRFVKNQHTISEELLAILTVVKVNWFVFHVTSHFQDSLVTFCLVLSFKSHLASVLLLVDNYFSHNRHLLRLLPNLVAGLLLLGTRLTPYIQASSEQSESLPTPSSSINCIMQPGSENPYIHCWGTTAMPLRSSKFLRSRAGKMSPFPIFIGRKIDVAPP